MAELSEYVPINLICVAVLGALGLRRLVRMERYHWPRVVILTVLLWVPAVYLFLLSWPPLLEPDCVPAEDRGVFTCTEM